MLLNKDEIKIWLDKANIKNYTINNDFTVDVGNSVDIAYFHLKEIPVQFGIVNGNFDCSHNELSSLQGSPQFLTGSFNCDSNQLKDLTFVSPNTQKIMCANNQLTSLKGSPKTIESMYCQQNELTSLEGAPKEFTDTLDVSNNKITSLIGIPKKIKNCLKMSHNLLTNLEQLKTCQLERSLVVDYNQLDDLKGIPHALVRLDCQNNPLTNQSALINLSHLEELFIPHFLNVNTNLELFTYENELEIINYINTVKAYQEKTELEKSIFTSNKENKKFKV